MGANLRTLLLALPMVACANAATFVLHEPIAYGCKDAKLRGCDELTDGVILYAAGEKDEGLEKMRRGVLENEPDKLREFATKLRAMRDMPGLGDYAKTLGRVADLLSNPATGAAARSESTTKVGTSAGARAASASTALGRVGSVVPAAETSGHRCSLLTESNIDPEPGTATCVTLGTGPMTVTDVQTTDACPDLLLVGAGMPSSPTWFVEAPLGSAIGVHGATYVVQPGETLFAVQVVTLGATPARGSTCVVTWAAH